jgi:hypothetical protein
MIGRPPIEPRHLKGMGAGVAVAAYSSIPWLMKALNCTEAEAKDFQANAQMDLENAMMAARRATGRMP